MLMYLRYGLLIAGGLIVAGCSDSDQKVLTPEAGIATYTEAICERLTRCASETDGETNLPQLMLAAAPDACAAAIEATISKEFRAALDAGTIVMDTSRLHACVESLKSACNVKDFDDPDACYHITKGTVAVGGVCTTDEVCAGDAFCRGATLPGCSGVCTARVARGEPCKTGSECSAKEGLSWCQGVGDQRTCQAYESHETEIPVNAGETCGWESDGSGGGTERTCPARHTCHFVLGSGNICVPYLAKGASCTEDDVCTFGTLCQDRGEGGHCEAILVRGDVGAACNEDPNSTEPFIVCNSLKHLTCSAENKCVTFDGREGSVCNNAMARSCADGFYCGGDAPDRSCVPLLANGASCSDGESCNSRFCDNNRCVAPVCEAAP